MQTSKRTPWGWIIVILASGTFLTAAGLGTTWRALQSRRWPSVIGEIKSSNANHHQVDVNTYWTADVIYKYVVNKMEYSGKLVNWRDYMLSESKAQTVIRKYQPGTSVAVYYYPNNPRVAVLNRDFDISRPFQALIGISLLLYGIISLIERFLPQKTSGR